MTKNLMSGYHYLSFVETSQKLGYLWVDACFVFVDINGVDISTLLSVHKVKDTVLLEPNPIHSSGTG